MKSMSSFLIVCMVGSVAPLAAQEQPGSPGGPQGSALRPEAVTLAPAESTELPGDDARWERLQRLAVGADLLVVRADERSSHGTLQAVDADSLTLRTDGQDQRIPRARIARVAAARTGHRRRNVLLGLAVGAAASGAATGFRCKGRSSACNEIAPAFFYPMAGAGTLIGALSPARDWEEIFRAEPTGR